jgi:hypothetical protein
VHQNKIFFPKIGPRSNVARGFDSGIPQREVVMDEVDTYALYAETSSFNWPHQNYATLLF